MSTTNTTPDLSAIKSLFAAVQALYDQEGELKAQLAALADQKNVAIRALAANMGGNTKIRHEGRDLTLAVGPDRCMIRGMVPSKATAKKPQTVIDLG